MIKQAAPGIDEDSTTKTPLEAELVKERDHLETLLGESFWHIDANTTSISVISYSYITFFYLKGTTDNSIQCCIEYLMLTTPFEDKDGNSTARVVPAKYCQSPLSRLTPREKTLMVQYMPLGCSEDKFHYKAHPQRSTFCLDHAI